MATMRPPAISPRMGLLVWSGWKRALAVASRMAKTKLKPATNSSDDQSSRLRSAATAVGPPPPATVLTPTPDIIDRYEGTRGRTHGETNEMMPAPKATTKPSGECWTSAPAPPPVATST